ncbi:HEPN domain-containing protein [Rickettsia felis]|uniref:HEPN domain-containing protein n=1 Tax=Rickettsia felis TaxID=42862 RepID=UPI0022A94139|nr:HEPN domain-containing protein [Rickettsia felis]
MAKEDYEQWYERGYGFLDGAYNFLEKQKYALAAFMLHQATESFYSTILLVFSRYKPKLHDIKKIRGQSRKLQ